MISYFGEVTNEDIFDISPLDILYVMWKRIYVFGIWNMEKKQMYCG